MDYIPRFMTRPEKLGMWKMTGKLKSVKPSSKVSKKPPKPSTCSSGGDNIGKLMVELKLPADRDLFNLTATRARPVIRLAWAFAGLASIC